MAGPIPTCEDDVVDAIADAARIGERLAITGGASKSAIGAPTSARPLPLRGLAGVIDYDPAELVLTVRPGTPLMEVEAMVAGANQMLAFEPFDHGPIFDAVTGTATIGGVVAAGVAGSQRVSAGGARDHLLGFRAVNGRAERFVAGAKVVKNVTGYDLPKLAAGNWGRLFALTELTLKVMPRPRVVATRVIAGLDAAEAVRAMAAAMGSQAEVAAAAHLPERGVTALRIQGFGPSVAARCATLELRLRAFGEVETPSAADSEAIWAEMRTLSPLGLERTLWRVNIPPSAAPGLITALAPLSPQWLLDWAGGLAWLALDDAADEVRGAAVRAGGHATLVRAPEAVRAAVSAFHPQPDGLAALETRVRRAFDPAGLFETGRF